MKRTQSVQGRLRGVRRALARATPAQPVHYRLLWPDEQPGVYTDEATGQRVTEEELTGQVITLRWPEDEEA